MISKSPQTEKFPQESHFNRNFSSKLKRENGNFFQIFGWILLRNFQKVNKYKNNTLIIENQRYQKNDQHNCQPNPKFFLKLGSLQWGRGQATPGSNTVYLNTVYIGTQLVQLSGNNLLKKMAEIDQG